VLLAVGAGWCGSAPAWGDTLIDTTGCYTNGSAQVSGTPNNANEVGNIFVAPTGYLKTFAANLAADGNQPVTLALYNANSSGPVGSALWTQPATIDGTGSASTYALQTFIVDQPLITGQTYAFALISGAPAANAWWASGQPGTTSGACYPGPLIDGYAGMNWFPPLTNSVSSFRADFETAQAPTVNPSPVAFVAAPAGTIGDAQTITITSPGQVAITLGQLDVSGSDGDDFVVVGDHCSGQTLTQGATCTVGVRFAPQATGPAARTAILTVPYIDGSSPPAGAASPPSGTVTDPLSGTAEPVPASAGAIVGATGPAGVTGPTGATGPAGRDGRIELVTCKAVTRTVKVRGRRRRVTTEQCTARLVSGTVSFTVGAQDVATLSRSGAVYAIGRVAGTRVVLQARDTIRPGRYVLTERRGRSTTRREVTIR